LTDPLAYYTAKSNGLDELAEEILEIAGMTDEDLPSPPSAASSSSKPLGPPPVITSQSELNWPQKGLGESYFDRALAAGIDAGEDAGYVNVYTNGEMKEDAWADEVDVSGGAEEGEEVNEDEGWDLDAEVIETVREEIQEEVQGEAGEFPSDVSPGVNEDEQWTRNSPLAADHAAAGSFETAMQVGSLRSQSLR
jgi:coatomer protein complex subunit alpha (xenin)